MTKATSRIQISLQNLLSDIRMRGQTDKILSPAWVIIPFLPVAISLVLLLTAMATLGQLVLRAVSSSTGFFDPTFVNLGAVGLSALGLGIVLFFVGGIIYIYLLYLLVRRRNDHFARQHLFMGDLAAVLRDAAAARGVDVEIPASSLERTVKEMKFEEDERSAVLWAILTLVTGIAGIYVLYFLTNDFHRHERREDIILEDVRRAFGTIGLVFPFRRTRVIPERNFAIYSIITLITLGLFAAYWTYVLIADPNDHFRSHILMEEELYRSLSAK